MFLTKVSSATVLLLTACVLAVGFLPGRVATATGQTTAGQKEPLKSADDLPSEAAKRVKEFEAEAEAIRTKADVEIKARRDRLIERLEALQAACTKEGRLAEAVAIRDRVRQLKQLTSIKEVMAKLNKGPQALTSVIGRELNEDTPHWAMIQLQTQEYVRLAQSMSKYDPPRGSKESWKKQTDSYAELATALDNAVQTKDKDRALAGHKELTQSCRACHMEHRATSPGRFSPGKFLAGMLIPKIDTDKDGKLSRGEMVAAVKQFYKDSDKDRKGSLDNRDLADGINRILPMPTRPGGPGAPPGAPGAPPALPPGGPGGAGPPMPPGGGMGGLVGMNVMKRADKNKDGKLTQEELVTAAEALFDEVDKDRTGKLDEEGVGKAIDQIMPMPGGPGGPRRPPQIPPR